MKTALPELLRERFGGRRRRGRLIARILARSWMDRPPEPPAGWLDTGDLEAAAPLLLAAGAGGAAWHRLSASRLRDRAASAGLQDAFHRHTLEVGLLERRLVEATAALRRGGVEFVLVKGWALGRLYPQKGMRPYGDIDLWTKPDDHDAARAALADVHPVDLAVRMHACDRSFAEVRARAELAVLGDTEIPIPDPADHLRLVTVHGLYHGLFRPLWLCDIGALLSASGSRIDWERFVRGDPVRTDWACCALGLAADLLDAEAGRLRRTPRWLAPAVLREWGSRGHYMHDVSFAHALRHPARLPRALRLRWPNPVLATVGVGARFGEAPRLPFQLAECVSRTVGFLRRPTRSRSVGSAARREAN